MDRPRAHLLASSCFAGNQHGGFALSEGRKLAKSFRESRVAANQIRGPRRFAVAVIGQLRVWDEPTEQARHPILNLLRTDRPENKIIYRLCSDAKGLAVH